MTKRGIKRACGCQQAASQYACPPQLPPSSYEGLFLTCFCAHVFCCVCARCDCPQLLHLHAHRWGQLHILCAHTQIFGITASCTQELGTSAMSYSFKAQEESAAPRAPQSQPYGIRKEKAPVPPDPQDVASLKQVLPLEQPLILWKYPRKHPDLKI